MSGGGNSSTVKNEPPAYLKPYLQDVASLAQQSFYGGMPQGATQSQATQPTPKVSDGSGWLRKYGTQPQQQPPTQDQPTPQSGGMNFNWPQYFPGSTVTPFSSETNQALGMQSNRALAGSPLNTAAQGQLSDTLSGSYLNGPGMDSAMQAAYNKITPMVGSAFGGAGRLHSGLADAALGQGLSDSFAGLYGDERQRMMAAAGMAPTLANQDYADIGQLANVGAQRESLSNQQLQDQISRFNYGQQLPYNMLQNYAGLIQGVPSIGGTVTAPSASTGQNLLGGGLAGMGMGSALGYAGMAGLGPWALGGAALMGLLE